MPENFFFKEVLHIEGSLKIFLLKYGEKRATSVGVIEIKQKTELYQLM